jgi:hypothetical protein
MMEEEINWEIQRMARSCSRGPSSLPIDVEKWKAKEIRSQEGNRQGSGPTFGVWQAINRETNEVVAEELDPSDALDKARMLGIKSLLIVCDYRRNIERI